MRTMTEDKDPGLCDLGSEEEADAESYLEDNSGELLDRLRELEAENSALASANENQREAYERCLDEVANHVVQALLNQKDLREECIKLKMLVFDLERQNRALCELFQQKLPNQPGAAAFQVQVGQVGPRPDDNAQPLKDSAKGAEPAHTEAQAKGNGYGAPHASPGPRRPASMEALSPFFKKKAHILEVLRKMEEADPLKFPPSTAGMSFCDYGQALASAEAALATGDVLPPQRQPRHARCHCSRSDAHRHVNGDEAATCERAHAHSCCLHCERSADADAKPCSHVCAPSSTQEAPAAAPGECHGRKRPTPPAPPKQGAKTEGHQKPASAAVASVGEAADRSPEATRPEQETPDRRVAASGRDQLGASCAPISNFDAGARGGAHGGLACLRAAEPRDPSAVSERDGADREASAARAAASVGPGPSCLGDVKAAAVNSPSKLLKLLKIPSMGEKGQGSDSGVRLSPQLTRHSRIPCRTNNYEVYHSPVPTRRATTTERCGQPPPPPARSESYPTTHSAPTSPPQPEDPPPSKELGCSGLSASTNSLGLQRGGGSSASSSSPKASQRAPHYENVCEMSAHAGDQEPPPPREKRSTLPSQTKANGGERKLVKSLPESVGDPRRRRSSSSSSQSTSDDEEDSESPAWLRRHGGPRGSRVPSDLSRPRRTPDSDVGAALTSRSEVTRPPPPTRRSESSSIPKRPSNGAARAPADSSSHAFKDRLAALGKLRSSEDLPAGLRASDATSQSSGGAEKRGPAEDQEEEQRPPRPADPRPADPPDGQAQSGPGGGKGPGPSQPHQQAAKSSGVKPDKPGLPPPHADPPQVLRSNIKCPGSLNLGYGAKPGPHSSHSPNKIPPKSPSRPCQGPSVYRGGKPSEPPRYSSKSEERAKSSAKGKKNPMYGDSLPPPPPRPPTAEGEKPLRPAPSPRSAIEQKVMKGIEENMLKLQEQDRGGPGGETKQKASNGIASWFLKKSKLPALNRKSDGAKAKDEKKEWKINIPSVGRDSAKMATRCREGVEGLNISTLMEKAEGLRRALEEERAYVERSGRGHSCEVVVDQAQGRLAVMYRGARSDNFMQQLLNRVDGKEVISAPQRRLSLDWKASEATGDATSHTGGRRDLEKGSEDMRKMTSEENLADPLQSHHFAGSGSSTYTLDSGIGTFPLPDCGAPGRGVSKMRAGAERRSSASPGRAGRRARTLERELTLPEECKHLTPPFQYGPGPETRTSTQVGREGNKNQR